MTLTDVRLAVRDRRLRKIATEAGDPRELLEAIDAAIGRWESIVESIGDFPSGGGDDVTVWKVRDAIRDRLNFLHDLRRATVKLGTELGTEPPTSAQN